VVFLSQFGKKFRNRAPARLSHDVADEKQFHGTILTAKYAKHTKESDCSKHNHLLGVDKPRPMNLVAADMSPLHLIQSNVRADSRRLLRFRGSRRDKMFRGIFSPRCGAKAL
jgi:hypothetical protein